MSSGSYGRPDNLRCLSSQNNLHSVRHPSSICQKVLVEATMSFNVTVKINLLSSRSRNHLEFSVNGDSIVSKLKRRVERRIHILSSKITMYYKKREVRNDDTFYDVGMGPGSVLSTYIRVSKGSEFDFDYLQLEPQLIMTSQMRSGSQEKGIYEVDSSMSGLIDGIEWLSMYTINMRMMTGLVIAVFMRAHVKTDRGWKLLK